MGWQPPDAQAETATMPDARAFAPAGSGHVTPLVIDTDAVVRELRDFWAEVTAP